MSHRGIVRHAESKPRTVSLTWGRPRGMQDEKVETGQRGLQSDESRSPPEYVRNYLGVVALGCYLLMCELDMVAKSRTIKG